MDNYEDTNDYEDYEEFFDIDEGDGEACLDEPDTFVLDSDLWNEH